MKRALLLLLGLLTAAPAYAQTNPIDASRRIDWSVTHPGVTGGAIGALPDTTWPDCMTAACVTLAGGTVTEASIEAAIASALPNTVVEVPIGTFSLTGFTFGGHDYVSVRGQGADKTFLLLTDDVVCHGISSHVGVCMSNTATNYKATPQNGPVDLTGTFTKGSTTFNFSAVTNMKVGSPIMIDQTDNTTDDGSIVVNDTNNSLAQPLTDPGTPAAITAGGTPCASNSNTPPCGTVGPLSLEGNGGGAQRTGRQQMQVVTVVSCGGVTTVGTTCTGTGVTVVVTPGLAMPNWDVSRSPQAWWASDPIHDSGISNMSIDFTGTGGNPGFGLANCSNMWVAGVRSINTNRSHAQVDYCNHVTVRDSYFFLTINSLSQSYGAECDGASDILFENNIFQAVTSPMMTNGACSGTVYGFNYQINNYYSGSTRYNIPGTLDHTAGIDNVLYEGNYGNAEIGDNFHGPHHFQTFFRNRYTGPQPACYVSTTGGYAGATFGTCNNSLNAIQLLSYSRFYNYVGNVLGTTGTNTNYQNGASNTSVWDLGSGNSEMINDHGTSVLVTVQPDPNVIPTLLRWGNVDSATGFTSGKFTSSEVPSSLSGSQAPYSNPLPGDQTLIASLYYTSKPWWWPSAKAWPPIGPDVTGGNVSNVGGHVFTLPAQDCATLIGIPADGTGAVQSFNAATCYAHTAVPSSNGNRSRLWRREQHQ